jgi:AcrR family transcriptional regulator
MKRGKETVSLGRPRTFDPGLALDRAMRVFWEKGYEGASVADLTEAMEINPPSLYAAFGNKEDLFQQVLARYGAGPGAYVMESLKQPTARAVAEHRLYGAVDAVTHPKRPRGCLAVQASARLGDSSDSVRQEINEFCAGSHEALYQRLKRAKSEGDLPAGSDPATLARYISTVAQGISLQAASGVKRRELLKVVEVALRAWPQERSRDA